MESWDLKSVEVDSREPRIISTADDARAILLRLDAGEELQEHEVHERARLFLVSGEVEVTTADGRRFAAGEGHLFEFAPGERHTVTATLDARLLLLLTPWPGNGHPGVLSLDQKRDARRRAAEIRG